MNDNERKGLVRFFNSPPYNKHLSRFRHQIMTCSITLGLVTEIFFKLIFLGLHCKCTSTDLSVYHIKVVDKFTDDFRTIYRQVPYFSRHKLGFTDEFCETGAYRATTSFGMSLVTE